MTLAELEQAERELLAYEQSLQDGEELEPIGVGVLSGEEWADVRFQGDGTVTATRLG